MANTCPHCGRPCYVGAWVVECDTKGCPNYAVPRPTTVATSPVKVQDNRAKTFVVVLKSFETGPQAFVFSDGSFASFKDMMQSLGLAYGTPPLWVHVVKYLKMRGVTQIELRNGGRYSPIVDGIYSITEFENQVSIHHP